MGCVCVCHDPKLTTVQDRYHPARPSHGGSRKCTPHACADSGRGLPIREWHTPSTPGLTSGAVYVHALHGMAQNWKLFVCSCFVCDNCWRVEGPCGSCGRNETQTSGLPRCKGLNWKLNTERLLMLLKNEHLFLHGSIFWTMYHACILRRTDTKFTPQLASLSMGVLARPVHWHSTSNTSKWYLHYFLGVLWSCPWTGSILFGKNNKWFHGLWTRSILRKKTHMICGL